MISLSLKEFALAVGAEPKWVLNAAARLGRSFAYTDVDAKWLRLARVLNRELRVPLTHAALLARSALNLPEFPNPLPSAASAEQRTADRSAENTRGDAVGRVDRNRVKAERAYGRHASGRRVYRHPVSSGRAHGDGANGEGANCHEVDSDGAKNDRPNNEGVERHGVERHGVERHGVTEHGMTEHGMNCGRPTGARVTAGRVKNGWVIPARAGGEPTRTRTPSTTPRERPPASRRRRRATLAADPGHGLRLLVDLARFESSFDAALGAARAYGGAMRAGRKPRQPAHYQGVLGRARRLGIDIVALRVIMRSPLESRLGGRSRWELRRAAVGPPGQPPRDAAGVLPVDGSACGQVAELLRSLRRREVRGVLSGELAEVVHGAPATRPEPCAEFCYEPSARNIGRLAQVLRELEARPRPGGRVPDAETFMASPTIVLTTRFGTLALRPTVAGMESFWEVERAACIMNVFDVDTLVLELAGLRQARFAEGKRDDMARLPYLDTVAALPLLDARRREVAAIRDAVDQHLKQSYEAARRRGGTPRSDRPY